MIASNAGTYTVTLDPGLEAAILRAISKRQKMEFNKITTKLDAFVKRIVLNKSFDISIKGLRGHYKKIPRPLLC